MASNESASRELEGAGAEALAALKDLEPETEREDRDVEEVLAELSEAQIAQILDRGVVNDRLAVKLPPDRVGYWVRERGDDIERYKALGGRIERTTEVGNQGLHGAADDRIRVGDVILMSIPRRIAEAIAAHDEKLKLRLKDKGKDEFLRNKVAGVPHYEEA